MTLLSATASDCLSAFGIPGGSTLSEALKGVFARRQERAREILIEELRRGDKRLTQVGDVDEVAAMVYRYARAAHEGTARLNLRLMAQVIAGQARLGNLVADEFLYYADILSSLRREEIIAIATLHRIRKEIDDIPGGREMYGHTVWETARRDLVPSCFSSENEFRGIVTSSMRTGLVIALTSMDDIGYFTTSPLMDRMERLAPFEAALAKEPDGDG